jgi:type I restriction enzyme S subunit
MTNKLDLHQRISTVLARRFQNNRIAQDYFGDLLREYAASGAGSTNVVNELETDDEGKLWSRVWEAMLFRHLHSHGYQPQGGFDKGPDFRIEHAGRVIWIEAVTPSPEGIPAEYLEIQSGVARTKPDAERVLRCTSVIRDKRCKLEGYRTEGIVGATDATVIALNTCRLSAIDVDGTGISQWPLSMEAVFPVGPRAVPITRDGKIAGPMQNLSRFAIPSAKGVDISTAAFLDPTFSNVSAVLQAHQRHTVEQGLSLSIVHNPLADVPLPTGLFGAHKELIARPAGNDFQIRDVRFEARLEERLDSLKRRFWAREDIIVRPLTSAEVSGFAAEPHKCHENANRWCFMAGHFSHLKVRGWLITGDGVLDKHSVVDIGAGELVDVTPMPDRLRRTFLRHDGNEDEFAALPNQIILVR